MEYQIIQTNDDAMYKAIEKLEITVQRLCKEGWRPQGGISIAVKSTGFCYVSQAMVR